MLTASHEATDNLTSTCYSDWPFDIYHSTGWNSFNGVSNYTHRFSHTQKVRFHMPFLINNHKSNQSRHLQQCTWTSANIQHRGTHACCTYEHTRATWRHDLALQGV